MFEKRINVQNRILYIKISTHNKKKSVLMFHKRNKNVNVKDPRLIV